MRNVTMSPSLAVLTNPPMRITTRVGINAKTIHITIRHMRIKTVIRGFYAREKNN